MSKPGEHKTVQARILAFALCPVVEEGVPGRLEAKVKGFFAIPQVLATRSNVSPAIS